VSQTVVDQYGVVHAASFDTLRKGELVCGAAFKWRHLLPNGDWAFLVVSASIDPHITCAVCLGSDLG
jgi:hypothetical protein